MAMVQGLGLPRIPFPREGHRRLLLLREPTGKPAKFKTVPAVEVLSWPPASLWNIIHFLSSTE